jgi:hypothetical protein
LALQADWGISLCPVLSNKIHYCQAVLLPRLNTNIYLLEQILNFPLVFLFDDGMTHSFFFETFVENALEASILIITKLTTDEGGDLFTFRRLQTNILRNIKPEYQAAFKQRKKENELTLRRVTSIQGKLKALRNKHIAHLTQVYFQETFDDTIIQEDRRHLLSEIKAVCEKLNVCFYNFAFVGKGKHSMLPIWYREDITTDKSDINVVLDTFAQKSPLLNLSECDLARWREIMDSRRDQLEQFNIYRKKFGLSEIDLD